MTYNLFIYEVNDLWPKPKSGDEDPTRVFIPLICQKDRTGDDISHHPLSAYFNVPLLAASTIALLA